MDDQKTYVLRGDEKIGTVQIANDVVAMIASYAAREVEGVSGMSGNVGGELMSKVGIKNMVRGAKVEIQKDTVTLDLSLTVEYGYNIPATSRNVQSKVKAAVENMTGLTVADVNIRIAGVNMQKNN